MGVVLSAGVARLVKLLNEERARQGLSGRELAERANLGVATVNQILNGKATPGLETLDALVGALGFTLESFMALALKASRKSTDAELLADLSEALPEVDRATLLVLARHLTEQRSNRKQ